jgi:hypothetical protein
VEVDEGSAGRRDAVRPLDGGEDGAQDVGGDLEVALAAHAVGPDGRGVRPEKAGGEARGAVGVGVEIRVGVERGVGHGVGVGARVGGRRRVIAAGDDRGEQGDRTGEHGPMVARPGRRRGGESLEPL